MNKILTMNVIAKMMHLLGSEKNKYPFFSSYLFSILAFLIEVFVIIFASIISGIIYHQFVYEHSGEFIHYLTAGILMANFYVMPRLFKKKYTVANYINDKNRFFNISLIWSYAFLCATAIAFITKTGDIFSRGAILSFYFIGLFLIQLADFFILKSLMIDLRKGNITARRIFLIGTPEYLRRFSSFYNEKTLGLQIVGISEIDDLGAMQSIDNDIQHVVSTVRRCAPDDVFILAPWSDTTFIDRCVQALMQLPASIHLGPDQIMQKFSNPEVFRFGKLMSLNLARPPLSRLEVLLKRFFDFFVAIIGIILLSPVFIITAIAIKLDSKGPVFFFQRRYGFNQNPFKIVKFRSMRTLEDGAIIRQAIHNDPRITRVGRFLRKTNIDELPQLLNVLIGNMSLVGPRPHAMAHDHEYEEKIKLYARRHNVKPGITGWAQVNGYRGETDTDDKMHGRVRHDLQYIDNWSMFLDIIILFLTFFSKRAFQNAR